MSFFSAAALLAMLNLPAPAEATPPLTGPTLHQARSGHTTELRRTVRDASPLGSPEHPDFRRVEVPTPLGPMAAWLGRPVNVSTDTAPIMVWVTGGFPPGGIDSSAWTPQDPDNDQSAQAFREAGMWVLYPTFRGASGNPGQQESFYGEVDDLLAAVAYARTLEGVDPERVYLGGHSTGGAMVLLAAVTGLEVRGIIAYGPAVDVRGYGQEELFFDVKQTVEWQLRAPYGYFAAVKSPTLVIEGSDGNADVLPFILKVSANPRIQVAEIRGADHFNVLAPTTKALAAHLMGKGELGEVVGTLQAAFDGRAKRR